MATSRVFISSVITGFEKERAAARKAVESLRQHPVMSEDFGAKPHSARTACLEGVRSSDLYVGILGERYGYVADSGRSVTEEEFLEARSRGIPILLFVQEGEKEPQQKAFIDRLKSYEEGYTIDFFRSEKDLGPKVVRAIHDEIGQPGVKVLDTAAASDHLGRHAWGSREPGQYETWLGMAFVPARHGETYVSSMELGPGAFQDKVLQLAMFGTFAIFRREAGIETEVQEDVLRFKQNDRHGQLVALVEIHTDGTLILGGIPKAEERAGFSDLRGHVIDESQTERVLAAFLRFAAAFYNALDRGALISSVYLAATLTGIGHKLFGKLPAGELRSISMGMGQVKEPVRVPKHARKVSRSELGKPDKVAAELVELFRRFFRGEDLYFDGKGGRH